MVVVGSRLSLIAFSLQIGTLRKRNSWLMIGKQDKIMLSHLSFVQETMKKSLTIVSELDCELLTAVIIVMDKREVPLTE